MSYLKENEYIVVPSESYRILHNCSGCGKKTSFVNTNNFRVNANGNKVDVWLIYQCEECKHTCNLPIYERVKPSMIPKEEYEKFLSNDEMLALEYGNDKAFFARNKAVIDTTKIRYSVLKVGREPFNEQGSITIQNPYGIKARVDKVLAEILHEKRNVITKQLREGTLSCNQTFVGCEGTTVRRIRLQSEQVV